MDLEDPLRYLAEVHVDDRVAVHGQMLERANGGSTASGAWSISPREQLANTSEFVSVHVDLDRRRATSFGAGTAELLDAQVAEARRDWLPSVSGTIGL